MKKVAFVGILLIGVSLYSIGNVMCDEIVRNACYGIHGTEHFYTVLPYFLPIFGVGVFLLTQKNRSTGTISPKSIILISSGISIIVVGALVVYYVPNPNFHIPRPNPYAEALKVLPPVGIILIISGIVIDMRRNWNKA